MKKKLNVLRCELKLNKETVTHLASTTLTQVIGAIPPTRVSACCTMVGCE